MNNPFSPKMIISLLVVYALSAGLTYALVPVSTGELVSPLTTGQQDLSGAAGKSTGFSQFANEAKTEVCPINGKLFSKPEKNLWETRRPILAMIENHVDSRPQSGLGLADIVYEAVAEGGITRFMGVFYCGAQADAARVAPVRSARIYFVNLAAEFNQPIYMHVGGGNCSRDEASGQCTSDKRAWAIEELAKLGWRKPGGNDFDTTGDIGLPVMKRDYDRLGNPDTIATEHTYVGYLPYAWKEAEKRGFTAKMADGTRWVDGFKAWKVATADSTGTPATTIKFEFWPGYKDFAVEWKYDSASKLYLRSQAGAPHIDLDTQQQLSASNVLIQFTKETSSIDVHKHQLYEVIGQGNGILYQNGVAIEVTWKKANQKARTIFTDKSGKEVSFVAGVTWVEILPSTSKVEAL